MRVSSGKSLRSRRCDCRFERSCATLARANCSGFEDWPWWQHRCSLERTDAERLSVLLSRATGGSTMDLDPVLLSRLQFAWVIGWHILLPAFTVGLGSFIAVLEGLKLATGRDVYVRISTFWIKILAIAFGMGVVTGIVMPFQFGTNWSRYADATSNVLSPLFAYEDLTAFFLEAG